MTGGLGRITSRGWVALLWRTWIGSNEKNTALIAGGVTFYILMAMAPSLVSLVSIYGLFANPHRIEFLVRALSGLLVPSAQMAISRELHIIVAADPPALGGGAIAGVLFATYCATRGMGGMIAALDIAYDQIERRNWVRFYLVALGFVVGGMFVLVLACAALVLASSAGALSIPIWLVRIGILPILLVIMSVVLSMLYHFGPDRTESRWDWTSPGAIIAAVLWIIQTVLTYLFVVNFGDYNRVLGWLGAVIVALSWLWFSIYLVLIGAEINGEVERQERHQQ